VNIAGFDFENRLIAIRLTNCTNCVVVDITATGCRDGVRVKRSSGVSISGNSLTHVTRGRGISVDDSPGATLGANVITDVKREGIRLDDSPGSLVGANTITQARRGIFLRDSDGATVAFNGLGANEREGLIGGNSDGVLLDNNTATGNGGDGYRLLRVGASTITNNDATGNGAYGFDVRLSPPFATEADLTAAGNTASGNVQGDFLVVD